MVKLLIYEALLLSSVGQKEVTDERSSDNLAAFHFLVGA